MSYKTQSATITPAGQCLYTTHLTVSDILDDSENSDSVGLEKTACAVPDPSIGVRYAAFAV